MGAQGRDLGHRIGPEDGIGSLREGGQRVGHRRGRCEWTANLPLGSVNEYIIS